MSFKYDVISYFFSIVVNIFFLLIFFSALNFKISKEKEVKVKLISKVDFISLPIPAENLSEVESVKKEEVIEKREIKKEVPAKKSPISKGEFSEEDLLKERLAKIRSKVSENNAKTDFSLSEEELKELEKKMLAFQKRGGSGYVQENTQGEVQSDKSLGLEYLLLIKRKLQNNFEIPIYLRSKKDLYAVVDVELSSDGKILKYQFLKKSEDSEFNRAVERCLKVSSPLPVNKSIKIIVEFKAEGVGKIK